MPSSSSAHLQSHPLALHGVRPWQAQADRFTEGRATFQFETLTFPDAETSSHAGSFRTYFSNNSASSTVENSSASGFVEADNNNKDDVDYIASQLNIEHSQRFVRRSAAALRSGSLRSSSHNCDNDFTLDQLAAHDVTLQGRAAQVQKLHDLYDNTATIQMATIIGPSGSGKSVLAQTSMGQKIMRAGFLVRGKFDVAQHPYRAIAQALEDFMDQVSRNKALLSRIQTIVEEQLGQEASILAQLVPSFKRLLAKKRRNNNKSSTKNSKTQVDRSITERASRIQNVFCDFLRIVSTKEHPITLLLDDIQWADPASLALMDVLLHADKQQDLPHFFVVSTCRQEYFESLGAAKHSNSNALQELLDRHSDRIHCMSIEGVDVDAVQEIINALLRMDDSKKTRGLAEIVHQKTNGIPYFVLEFMRALHDEELLYYETTKLQWTWLEHEISLHNVAENVAGVVSRRLQKLHTSDLFVVQVASCLSRTFEQDTMQFVLDGLKSTFENDWTDLDWTHDLDASLHTLVEKGILEFQRQSNLRSYSFAHDQLQQAAFRLIAAERKVPVQVAIGKRLIAGLDAFHRDQFLFTAVDLCAVGATSGDAMDRNEKQAFAFWAFLAGDAALGKGAFQSALKFLNQAVCSLGDTPFEDDAELALPLFSGYAEAAYCVSELDKAAEYAQLVNSQPRIPAHEKVRVALVELKVKCARRDFQAASSTFRHMIKQLGGGTLSRSPSTLAVLYHVMTTANQLKKYDKKKLEELPECTNPSMAAALSCHAAVSASLYVANPNLFVIAACKSVQWSLRYGVSKNTITGFCCFAMLLVSMDETAKALELAESALAICEIYNYKEALPLGVAIIFGFVRHWSRPLQQFVSPMQYGIDVGTRMGCMGDVAVAMNTFGLLLVLTSVQTLPETVDDLKRFRQKLRDGNHDDQACFTECNLQFAIKMAVPHQENESVTLNGDYMTEAGMRTVAKENNDTILAAFVDYFKMQLLVYFGQPLDAAKLGTKVKDMGFKFAQGTHMVPRNSFMIGIANVLSYKENGRSTHLRVAKAMLKRLQKWAQQSNPNVLHFLNLLQAELFAVTKKEKDAQHCYTEAMTASSRMGFRLDFALASELYALFQSDFRGDKSMACYYMEQALNAYESYGAMNKVLHLKRAYPALTLDVAE